MNEEYGEQRLRQMRSNWEQKTTEELLAVWKENNRTEWTDDTFGVIGQILLTRIGSLPPQVAATGSGPSRRSMSRQQVRTSYAYKHARRVARVWFAIAATVLTIFIYGVLLPISWSLTGLHVVLAFGPFLASGLCGAIIGAPILDPARVTSAIKAIWRGVLVAISAFVIYMVLISFADSVSVPSGHFRFDYFLTTLMFGTIIASREVGWCIPITGAFAGWSLYYFRERV